VKTILVNTSHNISIKYELAGVMHRALACGIDLLVLLFYFIVISTIAGTNSVLFYFLIVLVPGFYHLICEVFLDGQSLGKKLLKIRVVTLEGRKPSLEDYFLRWIFRSIEVLGSLGAIAAINIASTDKNQRIGDILAKTTVVKVIPENTVNLDVLRSFDEKEREITYPAVVRYSDKDMLLVKESLRRLQAKPNDENKKFVKELATRMMDELNVHKPVGGLKLFLETALVDYIFLTR